MSDFEEIQTQPAETSPSRRSVREFEPGRHSGAAMIKTVTTFRRIDGIRQIEADGIAALERLVPEGCQPPSVRRV